MSDLREYLKLQYAGNCKCGHCNLVPVNVIETTAAEIERLTAERDAARAKVAQYEQALDKLDGDSLDAIMEAIGEGEKFASYNLGKSKVRDWFLRRIYALIARPEVTK